LIIGSLISTLDLVSEIPEDNKEEEEESKGKKNNKKKGKKAPKQSKNQEAKTELLKKLDLNRLTEEFEMILNDLSKMLK
jgi:hypothetical protein